MNTERMKRYKRISTMLDKIGRLWTSQPEKRFGEILKALCTAEEDLFALSDERLERRVEDVINDAAARRIAQLRVRRELPRCDGCGEPTAEFYQGMGYERTYWCRDCIPEDAEFATSES